MYESYWQLKAKPFEDFADQRYYFPGESHQAALLKLRYAIENRQRGALLAGTSGTGKTLIIRSLSQTLGEQFTPLVHVVFPQMPTAELLGYLADQLDDTDRAVYSPTVSQSVQRIEQFLGKNGRSGNHAVIVIDEAHLLENVHTLEALRLLTNFESNGQPQLTLILTGQTALLPVLQRMPQLEERLAAKCMLRPFTEQETADYVTHRLSVAGSTRTVFEPDALKALHALTGGTARRINRLCDLTLLIGFAEEHPTITAEHVESVSEELVAVTPE